MQYRHPTIRERQRQSERNRSGQGHTEEDGHDAGAGRQAEYGMSGHVRVGWVDCSAVRGDVARR